MEISKRKAWTGRIVKFALLLGILYFGFIFPDSFSDHEKLVHFSAHVGMSFLLASCIYVLCSFRLHIGRVNSYVILIVTTLIAGGIYKYFEIAGQGILHVYSLGVLLEITGFYTSMSQNIAGILAAILLIQYVMSYWQPVRRMSQLPW
ncbi:MAG TPA: hypothetical protein VK563_15965 [Puia sp.]|nr:hypothetical protein [Puia sp.]